MSQEMETGHREQTLYYFTEEFSLTTVRDPISWILDHGTENKTPPETLTLIISSYGGDLHAAFALIDVMRGSRIPVHTVGLGIIASAGLLTFIAGQPGQRSITPNTSILSHQYSMGSFVKEHELMSSMRQADLLTKKLISHYRKCTKLKETVIRDKLLPPQDVWLSPEEAVELGLADTIRQLR